MTEGKKALLVMGCPEVPVQMSMVIYLAHKLSHAGWDVTVAGTDAAVKLLKAADPAAPVEYPTFEDGLWGMQLLEKVLESVAKRGWVDTV